MGKDHGFLEYQRQEARALPPKERIETFEEFHIPEEEPVRREQAAICMNCGVPFCQSAMKLSGMVTGCPLHNLIPEWNDEIYLKHDEHALHRLLKTSSFPEFTGRVCPALCEKACMCGQYGDPVTIRDNELFLIETAFENGWMTPRVPEVRSGKTVAVVGGGPSGLAAADALNRRGHTVTVYEREDRVGGLLMYGIPNMKLEKRIILRRKRLMEEEGVHFKNNVNVGVDITAEELTEKYDAVVLACGAKQPRGLSAAEPGQVGGVYYAVDFLSSTTRSLLKGRGRKATDLRKHFGFIDAAGADVIVVGGGDTGNDCIGTAIRHGCKSITALEMMKRPPENRAESNPWPEWPRTLKTDYGHEEAIALFGKDPRIFETTVKEVRQDKKGKIRELVTVKVAFENGELKELSGTEKTYPCDLLLIAAGFTGCESYTPEAFGVTLGGRGTVLTEEGHFATNVPGVFSAGDMRRGQSLVVWAIVEGRECAREVDYFLMGY